MNFRKKQILQLLRYRLLFAIFLGVFSIGNSQVLEIVEDEVTDGEETVYEENVGEEKSNVVAKDTLNLVYPTNFIAPNYQKNDYYTINNLADPKDGNGNGYISDPDDYISESDEYEINKLLWELEQRTTAQVAVVIVNKIGNEVPKEFAVALFKKWGIGYADKDNGLLIFTAINKRRTEFEVGYGLEPILTDLICHRIGTDEIVPYFKKGQYGNGLISAVEKVKKIIENPEATKEIYSQNIEYGSVAKATGQKIIKGVLRNTFLVYLLITLAIIYGDYQKIKTIDKSKEDYYDKYNDLLALKEKKAGCLSFFIFLIFPLAALYFYQTRKKRLKGYRIAPRYSRINGKKLFLKNEWAENNYLEEANIIEERIQSKEYDVWVTEDESDILILEYKGSSRNYSNCEKCGYKTYGKSQTITLAVATYTSGGRKKEVYLCKNCHYTTSKVRSTPKLVRHTSSSSSGGYSSSSSSYSSSSSSSSSWGGGSSGGGGAGVSW